MKRDQRSFVWMAPRAGFEPATNRLTAGCSTTELPGNDSGAITKPACFAKRERPAMQVEATAGIEPACTDLQSLRGVFMGVDIDT